MSGFIDHAYGSGSERARKRRSTAARNGAPANLCESRQIDQGQPVGLARETVPMRPPYKANSYAEGDNTLAQLVAKAIEAETLRREAAHNQGEMYPAWGEKLPGGTAKRELNTHRCAARTPPMGGWRGFKCNGYRN